MVLSQPTPEIAACFEDVNLKSQGYTLYQGPINQLEAYLTSLNYMRPSYLTVLEFASEFVANPQRAADISELNPWLKTVRDLAAFWAASPSLASMMGNTTPPAQSNFHPHLLSYLNVNENWRNYESQGIVYTEAGKPTYALTFWRQLQLTIKRQYKLVRRNKGLLIARISNSVLVGLLLGTLFLQLPLSSFQSRFGLLLFSATFIGFSNNAELPAVFQSKKVASYQLRGYSALAYVSAILITSLPLAILCDLIFGSIVYWMVGFAPQADRFFFFLLIVFIVDILFGSFLRMFAFLAASEARGQAYSQFIFTTQFLFAGFFVITTQIPAFLAWI
jgi:ABC-type multidrug transport system permease subunit